MPTTSTNSAKTVNDMDKIEKIRQEIERRKSLLAQHSKLTYDLILETFIKEYDDLLSFLDTLSDEPDKSLEEAAEEYASDYPAYNDEQAIAKYAFKRGAEWMAGQEVTLKVTDNTTWGEVNDFIHRNCDGAKEIQIRNKEESK